MARRYQPSSPARRRHDDDFRKLVRPASPAQRRPAHVRQPDGPTARVCSGLVLLPGRGGTMILPTVVAVLLAGGTAEPTDPPDDDPPELASVEPEQGQDGLDQR